MAGPNGRGPRARSSVVIIVFQDGPSKREGFAKQFDERSVGAGTIGFQNQTLALSGPSYPSLNCQRECSRPVGRIS